MEQDNVGLVLVTYQSSDDLPRFLNSLEAAIGDHPTAVIGVDNASTDGSADIIEEFGGLVIRNSTNVGLPAAINQGWTATTSSWILVANPDTFLEERVIDALIATAKTDDRIGMIGPAIARPDGTPYPSGRAFPNPFVGAMHAVLGGVWPGNPATRRYFGPTATAVADVDWISGCCMLFRREALEAIGGFDERYFLYFEETKAALDMHRSGWRVVLDPTATIRHREGGSMRSAPFRKVRSHHRSALRFYYDFHSGTPAIVLTPLVAIGLAIRATVVGARTALTQHLRATVATESR